MITKALRFNSPNRIIMTLLQQGTQTESIAAFYKQSKCQSEFLTQNNRQTSNLPSKYSLIFCTWVAVTQKLSSGCNYDSRTMLTKVSILSITLNYSSIHNPIDSSF